MPGICTWVVELWELNFHEVGGQTEWAFCCWEAPSLFAPRPIRGQSSWFNLDLSTHFLSLKFDILLWSQVDSLWNSTSLRASLFSFCGAFKMDFWITNCRVPSSEVRVVLRAFIYMVSSYCPRMLPWLCFPSFQTSAGFKLSGPKCAPNHRTTSKYLLSTIL